MKIPRLPQVSYFLARPDDPTRLYGSTGYEELILEDGRVGFGEYAILSTEYRQVFLDGVAYSIEPIPRTTSTWIICAAVPAS